MQWSQCRLMVGTRVLVSTHPRLLQCSLWQHFDELWNEAAFSLMCVETFCCATDRHEICTDECYPSIEHFLGACPRAVNADAIDAVGIPSRIVEPITITAVKRPDAQAWILSLLRSNWGLFCDAPQLPWRSFNCADVDEICTNKDLAIAALCSSSTGLERMSDELKNDRMVWAP